MNATVMIVLAGISALFFADGLRNEKRDSLLIGLCSFFAFVGYGMAVAVSVVNQ